MLLRACLCLGLVLTALAAPRPTFAISPDRQVVATAALRLGHQPPARVVRWLRAQPEVRWARIEADRTTVGIGFRDGAVMAILGRLQPLRIALPHTALFRARLHDNAGSGRAAVLLPFASELGVGSGAGDPEISALQSAGFHVDSAYDQQVTPATVQSFPQYNVVYDWTHTGVFSGTGWLATGQLGSCPPHYNADGLTAVLAVAGSDQCYVSVNAQFIATQLASFPAHALVFVNGCGLLTSDQFWQALSSKGVSTMVSWDNDSATYDDFLSAAAFFNQMSGGASVESALNTLYAAGYGHSSYQGQSAKLGFRGDGTVTLAAAAAGGSAPPPSPTNTPTPTSTPKPTPTPKPTVTPTPQPTYTGPPTATPTPTNTPVPTATPTNTLVPPSPTLSAAPSVKPGGQETLTVQHANPGSSVRATITFPDGQTMQTGGNVGSEGTATLTFTQPQGTITRHHSTARVLVEGDSPAGPYRLTASYIIGFGKIDLTAQPWRQTPGKNITVWVHTAKRVTVSFTIAVKGHKSVTMRAKTGAGGWAGVRYRLPKNAHGSVVVHARARVGHSVRKATTDVAVA